MLKLLSAAGPRSALRLMAETGVLGEVVLGPVALDRLARLIDVAPDADPLVRLAALLRPPPAGLNAAAEVATRWRMANRDAARLLAMTGSDLPDPRAEEGARARDLHRLGAECYADLVRIAAAEAAGEVGDALTEALAAAATWEPKRLPIDGDDILALGVPAGPRVGALLRALQAWWVAHDFAPDRAACLAQARRLLKNGASGGSAPD
jgi:poly(A) polymerase